MAIKVLATDGLAENGVELLNSSGEFDLNVRKSTSAEELAGMIGEYDCIIIRSATTLTQELIEKSSNMKLIVRAGAGVDNIDVPVATEKKIPVMNTASANSLAAAEQTIALMFSMLRMIPQASASLAAGKWERSSFKGREATGKTLGVVGLGNIGRIVCEKAIGLGMKVVGFDPTIQSLEQLPASLSKNDHAFTLATDDTSVLKAADILTLHIPKLPATTNYLNADRIGQMKDGAFLLNCARGGVVDENAVVEAVESKKLEGAAFDVFENEPPANFEHPLFRHPRIVCVPHLGASTVEAQKRVASTAAEQITGFFKNGDRTGVINGL